MEAFVAREGAQPVDVCARVVKYDGNMKDPQWTDVERGTAS